MESALELHHPGLSGLTPEAGGRRRIVRVARGALHQAVSAAHELLLIAGQQPIQLATECSAVCRLTTLHQKAVRPDCRH